MSNNVIRELNTFLEGHYMAIHGYEKYIQHVKDANVKSVLQEVQKNHKTHAAQVAERIQNLGGLPSDSAGAKGMMAEMMNKLKGSSDDTQFILKDAGISENKGIKMAEEVVKGDLDPESRKLIENILNKDREHVTILNRLVN